MKTSNKLVIIFLLMIISIVMVYTIINDTYQRDKAEFESMLTKKVVSNGDTLIIMDYSIINDTYILSNNTQISITTVKCLLIK